MQRVTVDGGNIRSVGYDVLRHVLEVEIWTGVVYRFAGVPLERYQLLMGSAHMGRYFRTHILGCYEVSTGEDSSLDITIDGDLESRHR